MKKYKKDLGRDLNLHEIGLIERFKQKNWARIKAIVDIVRGPVLILDKDLRVLTANDSFYNLFQVDQAATDRQLIYELGNGQWNIPPLRSLLEEILPKNTFFKGFDVTHQFPIIGEKTMILNARQINFADTITSAAFPEIIFLAIEDMTPIMTIAETVALSVKELAAKNAERILRLEMHIQKLEGKVVRSKTKTNKVLVTN